MPPTDAQIQALLDKEDCRELVRNYARGLDRCDAEMMKRSFHPDALFEQVGHFNGNAHEFCDFAANLLKTLGPQQHMAGQHIVELHGDTAYGECYGLSFHRLNTPQGESVDSLLGARLLDRYERRDDVWKIAHRRTIVEWNLDVPTNETMGAGGLGETELKDEHRGRKDREDPIYQWFKGL
jgi:ketosteroid isomerase-like protein